MASTAQLQFIETIGQLAAKACAFTPLLPSVMVAQAILESGWGSSTLSKKYNNYFGIKADKSWTGEKALLSTKEEANGNVYSINDYFRAYDSIIEGFEDRVKFLEENPRYTKAGVFAATTPEAQVTALKAAGYATASNYVTSIMAIVKQYSLTKFDKKKSGTSSDRS